MKSGGQSGQFEVLEKESKCTADNILTDIRVHFLSLVDESVPGSEKSPNRSTKL